MYLGKPPNKMWKFTALLFSRLPYCDYIMKIDNNIKHFQLGIFVKIMDIEFYSFFVHFFLNTWYIIMFDDIYIVGTIQYSKTKSH